MSDCQTLVDAVRAIVPAEKSLAPDDTRVFLVTRDQMQAILTALEFNA